MAILGFLTLALGLVATTQSRPLEQGTASVSQAEQEAIGNLFQTGVNSALEAKGGKEYLQQLSEAAETSSAPQACEDVYLIFARGTFEPGATAFLGGLVGGPFSTALTSALGIGEKYGAIGVDYNNGVAGYLSGGDGQGSKKMAEMISSKASQCPNSKLVVSGYR
jgi:hypothetical protein